VQDLIGSVVVNIFFSIGWLILRRNSYQKGRTLQEMNIQMSRQQHILGEQNLALVQSEQFRLNMLSIVSHDLKAPISNVLGLSSVLLDNPALEEPTRLIVEHLQEAGSRMNRLVADILDTAAREMGKIELVRQPTDIVDVMTTAVAHYTQAAKEKNQLFILDMASELFAFADEQRLIQVFDNLISNAVKYSPFGGRIWVQCWQIPNAVRVSVKDEGAGLSIEDQQKLFGFFQRLSTEPTGGESSSGVGLSIVKQIVELHGGRVWCESDLGKGATFIVELPCNS
jgi:signal transduction histidine kinase